LRAYQAAKKEIQDFHDHTMSDRLRKLVESREAAKRKAEAFRKYLHIYTFIIILSFFSLYSFSLHIGSKLTLTPISGAQYFSDSITLQSNDQLHELSWTRSQDSEGNESNFNLKRSSTSPLTLPALNK
jgi:hypothetical protein